METDAVSECFSLTVYVAAIPYQESFANLLPVREPSVDWMGS